MYQSTKTYDHNLGFSCAFRQWRAESHCRFLHGYALSFKFIFEAEFLDDRNWVVDFGSLGGLKERLSQAFDHKLVVAIDDPQRDELCALSGIGCADAVVMDRVGCEAFAEYAFDCARAELRKLGMYSRVKVISCEVREHGANSAVYNYRRETYGDR